MRRKAAAGDLLRIIRPHGHRLAQDTPIGRVFRVARVWSDGVHTFYGSSRSVGSYRSDEVERLDDRHNGRPTRRALRNRRRLATLASNRIRGPRIDGVAP